MFNVTGGELVIIFLAALVILGPERLPEGSLGRWAR
ncbi:MAG: twin-arginine translocase TatA/TatE family subunit [Acidimicrobiales bacterium]